MNGTKLRKLYVYQHEARETIIDTYETKDFGEIVIVKIGMIKEEEMRQAQEVFKTISERTHKQYIIVSSDVASKIEFYGVCECP